MNESQFRIAIPVRPIDLFGIGPEQSGINYCQAVLGQQSAAVAAENEPALVFADQAPSSATRRVT
ncbi:MAG: hypothetical protein WA970_14545 [Gammaproteobacteria bacterium]